MYDRVLELSAVYNRYILLSSLNMTFGDEYDLSAEFGYGMFLAELTEEQIYTLAQNDEVTKITSADTVKPGEFIQYREMFSEVLYGISAKTALYIQRVAVGLEPVPELTGTDFPDIDGNGIVTSGDAMQILILVTNGVKNISPFEIYQIHVIQYFRKNGIG